MARISTWTEAEEVVLICEARASSFEAVRETRMRLKPFRESCRAYSLPMPSEAPVMTAQEPLGPKEESCRFDRLADDCEWTMSGRPERGLRGSKAYRFPRQNERAEEDSRSCKGDRHEC